MPQAWGVTATEERADRARSGVRAGLTIFGALLALVGGVASPASGAANAPRCTSQHWVGAWAASPSDADSGTSGSLAGVTARNVITPLGSGDKVRIDLTNALSTQPITVDAASLGTADGGARVRAKSMRQLLFNGKPSVTIPAGGVTTSDPVTARVRAFERLAVSVYVDPSSNGVVTEHYIGRQTSYFAAGNQALQPEAGPFGAKTTSRFVVSGLDVKARQDLGAVAAFGDSITDGDAPANENPSGIDQDVRYPDFLARRLTGDQGQQLTVLNAGISGNRILRDGLLPFLGPSGLSRLDRDVIDLDGVRTVIILEGINDIGQTPFASSQEVIAGLQQLVERLRAAGLQVLVGTITPAGGTEYPSYSGPEATATRNEVNAWIRSQQVSNGVVDFDAALRDPADQNRLLPAFDSGDHIHPSAAGYEAMAAAVPLSKLGIGSCG